MAYGRQRLTVSSLPLGGNLAHYRVNYIAHGPTVHTPGGKVQQMSDMRHMLARQWSASLHSSAYPVWPPPHVTYAALPPPSYAYGAFSAPGRR